MTKPVRFLMIGGFLGAGKTTAIARAARHFTDQGLRVGLVTNDQAYDLVDTHSLRAQGFDVGEVPGACFCCKFDDLVDTVQQFDDHQQPDLIIAEPVGSCTDLAATVIEPLRSLYGDRYDPGPLAVLLKPEHGRKILRAEGEVGFSPKAAYIFLKQIEEADIVAVNKIDKLSDEERDELVRLVEEKYPDKTVIATSVKTGAGFDQLLAAFEQVSPKRERFMEVDYDIYAEGEAELGWLNCQVALNAGEPFSLDDVVVALVTQLRDALLELRVEPAHLKVLAQNGQETSIANLVGSDAGVELSLSSAVSRSDAELIVNARVAADPEQLEQVVRRQVEQLGARLSIDAAVRGMQRFRPGRPVPTHRLS